jgi:hypothetical protein
VTDWTHGSALVAHFEPCRIDFEVPAEAANPPPLFDVRVDEHDLVTNLRIAPHVEPNGIVHFDLARVPCGDLTVVARWKDHAGDAASSFCSNADPEGRLPIVVTRSSYRLVCAGRAAAQ